MYYLASVYGVTLVLCYLQPSWSRYLSLSLSLNLSLALNDDEHATQPHLTLDMLRSCMKQTELSMAQLRGFRADGLPSTVANYEVDNVAPVEASNDDDGTATNVLLVMDYEMDGRIRSNRSASPSPDESLHCFTHCLYEQLGYYKNGVLEEKLLRELDVAVQREQSSLEECMNLESENKCEATHKVHLCYSRLKTLQAERQLRHIIEYGAYPALAEQLQQVGDRDSLPDNLTANSISDDNDSE